MRIVENLSWQGAAQIFSKICTFVFYFYTASVLGVQEFGRLSFALSVAFLILVVMDFGLDLIATRSVARDAGSRFYDFLWAKMVSVSFGLLIGSVLSISLWSRTGWILPLFLISCAMSYLQTILFAYFRGKERMEKEAFVVLLERTLVLVFLCGLFFFKITTAVAPALAYAASHLLAFFFAFLLFWRMSEQSFPIISIHGVLETLRAGIPMLLTSAAWMVYFRIDSVLLGIFAGFMETGLYQAAYRLMEGLILVPATVMSACFPRLSQTAKGTEATLFSQLYRRIATWLFLLGLAVCGVAFGLSPWFLTVFLQDYKSSVPIFQILTLALFCIFLGHLTTQALVALNRERDYFWVTLSAAGINVVFNFLVIPRYGAWGAAWVTVLTETFVFLSCGLFVYFEMKKRSNMQ